MVVICADEGHETADCESVKILVMQNRQQNYQNREICQICDMQRHSAKTCRKISINQQSTFPSNNYNFQINHMNTGIKIEMNFYEQIIKIVISSQIIQIIIIEETLIDKV